MKGFGWFQLRLGLEISLGFEGDIQTSLAIEHPRYRSLSLRVVTIEAGLLLFPNFLSDCMARAHVGIGPSKDIRSKSGLKMSHLSAQISNLVFYLGTGLPL